jgi:bzd-type benzoyl-CoA reductase N subunit
MADFKNLDLLLDAARAPLREWPVRYPNHRAIGYLCSYVPEELIHAAGFTPVRVRGTTAALSQVDAHLQSFTCALCRSTLDQALTGDLSFLKGMVFAHTCDAMQAQADLWRMTTPSAHFVDTVMQPANLGAASAGKYLVGELHRFRERLATFADHPIEDEHLVMSIELFDETRGLVSELQKVRDQLGAEAYFAVLDAAQMMPREIYNPLLKGLLSTLLDAAREPGRRSRSGGPRLFLTGAVLDEPRLLDLIGEVGARVSGDDLCSGSRHFLDQIGTDGDALANLAAYFLRRPPCPTKLAPSHNHGQYLLDQVRHARADGVIFVLEKFCEPHAFDYALVRPMLDQTGIPHLLLEMEQTPSLEALRTRLQAFVEIL